MNLTNRLNLPDPIYRAVANDSYTRGGADISVTGLLNPPRKAVLENLYKHQITVDVVDRIWALVGQVGHAILERADVDAVIQEERLYMNVEGPEGLWSVSGKFDRLAFYEDHGLFTLEDYKFTSVWAAKFGKDEWEQQLNMYAELLRRNGYETDRLRVVAILRDWRLTDASRSSDYPQAQIQVIEVPKWPSDRAMAFIEERVAMHQDAYIRLPKCTPEERWQQPDTWAIKRGEGASRATRVVDSEQEALDLVQTDYPGSIIEHRPGHARRCALYCDVVNVCKQALAEGYGGERQ